MATALNTIVLDLGTTSIKAATCVNSNQIERVFLQPAPEISVDNGHYLSDAMAYLAVVDRLLEKCQRYCQTSPILGLCFQRSSFVIWDSHSGLPVTPLISWQDNRGKASCEELQEQNGLIRQITGLPLTPYYYAPKLRTFLHQQPELRQDILNSNYLTGTLDSFLIWHWTHGKCFLTDASMAARTQLMDINKGVWSETLADIFDIPLQALPKICTSNDFNLKLKNGIVLRTCVADQSAAMLASVGNDSTEVLVNLGTGGFVIRYEPDYSNDNTSIYLRTLIYQDSQKGKHIALEGTLNSISAALQPYPFKSCRIEDLAELDDIYCLAEPTGIGAPYFCKDIGLEFSQDIDHLTKQQIASLLLEGIIFRVALILEQFNRQAKIQRVNLSGGLSALPCLQQGIALCSPAPVYRLLQKHSGLQGVAILTNNLEAGSYRQTEIISVNQNSDTLIKKYKRWKVWFSQKIKDYTT